MFIPLAVVVVVTIGIALGLLLHFVSDVLADRGRVHWWQIGRVRQYREMHR